MYSMCEGNAFINSPHYVDHQDDVEDNVEVVSVPEYFVVWDSEKKNTQLHSHKTEERDKRASKAQCPGLFSWSVLEWTQLQQDNGEINHRGRTPPGNGLADYSGVCVCKVCL